MRPRNALLAILFVLTTMFGAWILFHQRPSTTDAEYSAAPPVRQFLDVSGWVAVAVEVIDILARRAVYYVLLLAENKELLLYGAVALFGILMMGLAIGNATSGSRDSGESVLDTLKHEKQKAENLARLKSEFLNQVSHELRTPLAVIIGYLECITDGLYGQLEAKHKEILSVVSRQSTHLKNMIDQILIYSRLEGSKQPLHIEEFSLHKTLDELRETFEFLCAQKGIGLGWEISKEPSILKSDPERFKEMLSNLLQNAVKYTDRGSVKVSVRALSTNESILLEVSDTGVGIPEHHLSTIFEPFMQVHKTSTENSRGGIGLGLSIVKKHIEQIGGTITVESEVGKGTTFRIILPRIYEEKKRRPTILNLLKFPRQREKAYPPMAKITSTRREAESDRATG